MKVSDIMTSDVVTVQPETPLKVVAQTLIDHRISGVPVVTSGGDVVGVISESDLILKERGLIPQRTGLFARLVRPATREDRSKVNARTAGEAMTSPAVTVPAFFSIATAARAMIGRGVDRLPVVTNDRLVGIVTRSDLVRAFGRPDEEVIADVHEQIDVFLALDNAPSQVEATIENDTVRLAGELRSRESVEALTRVVAQTPGVIKVDSSSLRWVENAARSQPKSRRDRLRLPI